MHFKYKDADVLEKKTDGKGNVSTKQKVVEMALFILAK